jgi:Contractile injection system tube protein/LysM domain
VGDVPLAKALIVVRLPTLPLLIPVMFNPPEYQLVRSNEYAEVEVPGLGSSVLQFVRGHPQTLTMDLFFDTTATGVDVRLHTGLVIGLTDINPETHAPPELLFLWGSLVFPCVLESVTQQFNYFDPLGLPLRAQLSVTLRGADSLSTLVSSIPLQSPDRAKGWVVRAGDTLAGIAAQEYGDPRQWRVIARASGLDDPLAIAPGVRLTIPPLP